MLSEGALPYASAMRLYDDPSLYDVLHSPGTAAEARALARIYQAETGRSLEGAAVLEPACGTGRLLRSLERTAARTIGFDESARMIEYARGRLSSCELFVADMCSFATSLFGPRIDLAVNTINTIRHLSSDRALLQHLHEIHRVLAPGGRYLVGLSLVDYEHDAISEDLWEGARGRLRVQQVVQYLPPDRAARQERVLSHIRVHRPSKETSWDESYVLRAYDHRQWSRLLGRSPLRCSGIYSMDGSPLAEADPTYSIFSLRSK